MPATINSNFAGTAQAFQASLASEPMLIAAALVTVYIVLGILYESLIHPITILSTLPSAGVGAILALMLTHTELSVIALIGIILLIGIVKKNAIMMIDFALEVERREDKTPEGSDLRSLSAAFPSDHDDDHGGDARRITAGAWDGTGRNCDALGITIVGGLIVSQALTLYTTPVIYLYMDRLSMWIERHRAACSAGSGGSRGAGSVGRAL